MITLFIKTCYPAIRFNNNEISFLIDLFFFFFFFVCFCYYSFIFHFKAKHYNINNKFFFKNKKIKIL